MADHPLFAALYDRMMAPVERAGLAEHRRRLLAAARGRVLEVGAGTGANLPHYREVSSLTLLEPDAAMRRRLAAAAASAPMPVEVIGDGIDDASLAPGSFDTVVSTLALCTVASVPDALAAMRAALAPHGRLLFLEHVAAPGARGRLQEVATPVWARLAAGCHPHRDIPRAIRSAGFSITDLERFAMPRTNPLIRPAVQGVARP
jgi:SAM-dependent methyltransferase